MRRMNGIGLFIFILVLLLLEWYTFQALRFATRSIRPGYRLAITGVYLLLTIGWYLIFFFFNTLRTADLDKGLRNVLIVYFMGMLLSKILIGAILLIDDLKRLIFATINLAYAKGSSPDLVQQGMSRSAFLTRFALLFGGSLFGTVLYGMSNRYNYSIRRLKLSFPNLPSAFHGLKIVQLSDIHSGSLNDREAVRKGVQMVLDLKPDLIVFTGDLVNNKQDEMLDYIDVFKELRAPMGVYSILGNHDYGDYVEWPDPEAKQTNLQKLKQTHKDLGWNLLLDQHVEIQKDGQSIALLGVQNISAKGFSTYGDLSKAYAGSEHHPFKILLSHDPSHWDHETLPKYPDINLTLSGHTHGMQFGVDISWLKWSPVQYAYKRWAGLYEEEGRYLYVNRGYGFIGYPGRVGILPEITCFELS